MTSQHGHERCTHVIHVSGEPRQLWRPMSEPKPTVLHDALVKATDVRGDLVERRRRNFRAELADATV
jgi:hypothetical protein